MIIHNIKNDLRIGIVNTFNLITVVITFLLGVRIILRLVGANPETPFVYWINTVSNQLVYPFNGIFPNINFAGSGVFDIVAAIALIIYLILAYLIIALINSALNSTTRHINQGRIV